MNKVDNFVFLEYNGEKNYYDLYLKSSANVNYFIIVNSAKPSTNLEFIITNLDIIYDKHKKIKYFTANLANTTKNTGFKVYNLKVSFDREEPPEKEIEALGLDESDDKLIISKASIDLQRTDRKNFLNDFMPDHFHFKADLKSLKASYVQNANNLQFIFEFFFDMYNVIEKRTTIF